MLLAKIGFLDEFSGKYAYPFATFINFKINWFQYDHSFRGDYSTKIKKKQSLSRRYRQLPLHKGAFETEGTREVMRVNRFMIESLRNELMNRGITIHKAAEIAGIEAELLRQSFDGDRELSAKELVAILTGTGIPIEKIIYKAPEETGVKVVEWDEKEVMSKEFALATVNHMLQFCRLVYFQPKVKPFNGEIDFEATCKQLNGLKEFIENNVRE